jgi:hypothetical protein
MATTKAINFDDLDYTAPPSPDVRTLAQRTTDEITRLRGQIVTLLATEQEQNRRLAVLEHRLAVLEAAEVAE